MAFKVIKTDKFQQRDYFGRNKIKKCLNYDLCCGEISLTHNHGVTYPCLCDECSFILKNREPSIKRTNKLVCNICRKKEYCYKRYDCHHVLCKICVQLCDYGYSILLILLLFLIQKLKIKYLRKLIYYGNLNIH